MIRILRGSIAAGCLALATSVAAQTPAGTPVGASADASRIPNALRVAGRLTGDSDPAYTITERMRYWNVPAVSIAVIDNFRIVYARGFGITEFGGATRVDTTTLFQAGSISKPVFATGALRLVEQGTLSLDEDVNARLKSWRVPDSRFTATEKVTLRRLLTHSAGLTVWGFPGYAATAQVPTVPQVLDGASPANTAAVRNDTTPGARWLYSGGGYTVAQLLASDATGEPFPRLMRRLVLAPAGMRRSTYENPLPASAARSAASGHERIDTPVPGRYHTYPEMAAAGLWTTAPELARWAIALSRAYNGTDSALLKPATARQMISAQVSVAQQYGGGSYGLGVAITGQGDSIRFSHNGRDEGFVASMFMYPKLGRGLVVMTNGISGALLTEITRAFAETYGLPSPPRMSQTAVAVDAELLKPLTGEYVLAGPTDSITVRVAISNGELWFTNTSNRRSYRLYPLGSDAFFDLNSGGTILFEREGGTPDGRVRAIRMGRAPNAPTGRRKP
jgi:CubicO group peptidase (beta-lactamase class C family)